jgi:hypothetical protein
MKKQQADKAQTSTQTNTAPGAINQTIVERHKFKSITCDRKKKIISQLNGEPRIIHWPKNVGTCILHLVALDKDGKEIPNTEVTLPDTGDELESYTAPKGAFSIAYYCTFKDFDGDTKSEHCILEIDRR